MPVSETEKKKSCIVKNTKNFHCRIIGSDSEDDEPIQQIKKVSNIQRPVTPKVREIYFKNF